MPVATKIDTALVKKYNVAAPRYTSYPTVPYWDASTFTEKEWLQRVQQAFTLYNKKDGISLYIHLPYCESLCTYCGCNTRITVNHQVEKPYVDGVLKEWKKYLELFSEKPRISQLHLGGGTPTFFSAENLEQLIQGIFENAEVMPHADLSFEAHPANTTEQHLQTLYNLGFRRLSLGIQDFDLRVQEMINRHQTLKQVKQVCDAARKIGYTSINFDLIYGLPLQTPSSVQSTIEKVIALQPQRIAFYSYAHVPWLKPGQRKYTEKDLPAEEKKLELYELGRELFLQNGYTDIGMDHFALPGDELHLAQEKGELHRNFMGYTTSSSKLLIGLGVSSISDCWDGFAQNHKTVEEYLKAINNDGFAFLRGHLLNEEDIYLRQHILNLMCRFYTEWQQHSPIYPTALAQLQQMQKDGLLAYNNNSLQITVQGQRFVRNACMLLDARLLEKQPVSATFSAAV